MNQKRITTLAFITLIISFVASTVVSLNSLHGMMEQNQRQVSKLLAAEIYDTISSELSQSVMVSRTMGSDRLLAQLLEKEEAYSEEEMTDRMKEYLNGIREELGYESVFVISEKTGRYYTPEGINKVIDPQNSAYDRWYSDFLSSGLTYDLDVDNDEFSQDVWTVFVNCRISDANKKLLGVCGVGSLMTKSQSLFHTLEEEYQVKISLIDSSNLVQVDTNEETIEHQLPDSVDLSAVKENDYSYQKIGAQNVAVIRYVERLGWYLVVQSDGSSEQKAIVSMIAKNAGVFLVIMAVMMLAVRVIVKRTISLTDASFKDSSTGLYNRRAFEEAMTQLKEKPLPSDFVYMIADVNELKTANDNLGHAAGDELISGAAACLKACFEPYGRIYRIGGDEFAVLMRIRSDDLKQAMEAFRTKTAGWKGQLVHELEVSCGYASVREYPDVNAAGLSEIADERMYEEKEQYYTSCGKDRRRR